MAETMTRMKGGSNDCGELTPELFCDDLPQDGPSRQKQRMTTLRGDSAARTGTPA